jgi:hypothetical protein
MRFLPGPSAIVDLSCVGGANLFEVGGNANVGRRLIQASD